MLSLNNSLKGYIVKNEPMERIGGIFAKGRLNLLHGIQGSGKSYGAIKALNSDGIEPVHVNLDESTGFEELKVTNVGEDFMIDLFLENFEKDFFDGHVVMIDTYTRLEQWAFSRGIIVTKEALFNAIEAIDKYYSGLTLIIVGHTQPFVGRDGIFNDNLPLVRGCAEELYLEKQFIKASKTMEAHTKYTMHVCKGRGYDGKRDIAGWMRD